jgi:hypothetical protein
MKCVLHIVLGCCVCLLSSTASARPRTWTAQNGDTLTAEFTGVKDGKVVLKVGSKRKYFPLSTFSLADRDEIVKELVDRRKQDLIELITAANKERRTLRRPTTPRTGSGALIPLEPGRIPTREDIARLREQMKARATDTQEDVETFYGLPVPTPDLIIKAEPREWTDVFGNKNMATFAGLVEPGHVMLDPELGASGRFSLTSFSAEDIAYIGDLLKKDAAAPVFPADGFQPLSDEDQNRGYRTWTDRLGVKLNGKYVRKTGKDVVFKTGPDETDATYPYVGLSKQDRAWIDAEIKRISDEARRKREAEMASRQDTGGAPGGDSGGGSRSPFASRFPRIPTPQPPRPPRFQMPEYKFQCEKCGKEWTSHSMIGNRYCDACQNELRNTYEFHCTRCGYNWTRKNQILDHCPRCSGEVDKNGGNGGSTNTGAGGSVSNGGSSSSSGGSLSFLRSAKVIITLAVLAMAAIGGVVKKAVG